jgi:hypothetical protein
VLGFVVEDILAGAGAGDPDDVEGALQSRERIGIVLDDGLIGENG